MTALQSNLRAVLAAGVVGIAVYAYGIQPGTIKDRFANIFYEDRQSGFWQNKWFGVLTLQNPNDAWIIQEIMSETKPDYIIEAGTLQGGSALLWATILREVNPDGRIITIDIEDKSERARGFDIAKRITFMIGSSTDPKIVSQIADRVKGKRVLVILDSNHTRDHVLSELKNYTPMVQVGGYVVVQDSNINGHPVRGDYGPGPMEAINDFLSSNSDFQADRERERLMHTTNPKGYLKRLR